MEAMREHWTDDRMDDLAQRVESGFASVDARFTELHEDNRQLRREMIALRSELRADNAKLETELRTSSETMAGELRGEMKELRNDLRSEIHDRFKAMERRFDIIIGTMVSGLVGLVVSSLIG